MDRISVGKGDLSIDSDLRSVEECRIQELEDRKGRRRTKFSTCLAYVMPFARRSSKNHAIDGSQVKTALD